MIMTCLLLAQGLVALEPLVWPPQRGQSSNHWRPLSRRYLRERGLCSQKLFVYASKYAEDFHDAAGYGWSVGTPNFDWATLRDRKNSEIERLNGIYRNMLVNSGCDLIDGRGRLVDEHTVEVGGKQYTAERILLATGAGLSFPVSG